MGKIADAKLNIINLELERVQSSIDKYDDIIFRIRSWEVTVWSALMVVFFQFGKALVLPIAILVPFIFWGMDSLYKSFRETYRDRRTEITEYLASKRFERDFASGRISFHSPTHPTHRYTDVMRSLLRPHLFLMHLFLSIVAVLVYFGIA